MMNILHFYRFSVFERMGGTIRYIDNLCREMARQGHRVDWLCTTQKKMNSPLWTERAPGYKICQIPVHSSWLQKERDYFLKIPEMIDALDQETGYDAFIIHDPLFPWLYDRSKFRKKIDLTNCFHMSSYIENGYNASYLRQDLPAWKKGPDWVISNLRGIIERYIEHANFHHSDRIIALSEYTRQMLTDLHGVGLLSKTRVIPSGVDIRRFSPATDKNAVREQLNLPHETPILFTVRNLIPRMGLENLICAASRVKNEFPGQDFRLVIGGRGTLREKLQKMITEMGLENQIYLLGSVSEEELPLYYQACDFFVLPTEALEGFGLVTLEALATNTPVIGTPIGATPELIKQFDPDLVTHSIQPDDIARMIINCLQQREGLLNRWDSRSLIEKKYDWEVVTAQVIDTLCRA
jgi:glycosyltransferase involved in cell wall biosynthesis